MKFLCLNVNFASEMKLLFEGHIGAPETDLRGGLSAFDLWDNIKTSQRIGDEPILFFQ